MRTRREQMQAYRFVIRRIVSALLSGEPETLDRPMRRLGLSMFVSAMAAVIAFAAFGVYGLLANPGGDLKDNTLVIERGTGAIYVFFEGRLHPVLNITSARLILEEPADPRTVSAKSLVDTPRGPTLGIRDAPEALPGSGELIGLPWRVCSVPPAEGATEPTTTVVIDRGLSGVSALGEQALYVTSGDEEYLLWNNTRLRVRDRSAVVALQLPTRAIEVGQPLVGTVSAGPDLAAPRVDGAGDPFDGEVDGQPAEVGQVFEASGSYYLLARDRLARDRLFRIGEVSWALLADRVPATPISAEAAGNLLSDDSLEPEGFPQTVPVSHPAAGGNPTVCTAYEGDPAAGPLGTTIEVFESTPEELSASADALEVAQTERDSVSVADRVVIAGGRGALVQGISHAGTASDGDTLYLITDQGIKYPLGAAATEALGYGEVDPDRIPVDLLAMVPTGPPLTVEDAQLPVSPA